MLVGAGQKTGVADVNERRVLCSDCGVVQPQLVHGGGLEVMAQDVGPGQQARHHFATGVAVQVQRNAFFVAVKQGVKARAYAQQFARAVACQGFDLDDIGTHIAQHHAAGGAHHHVREL